ncbi:MAG: class I SAM-dependent methyltransferase [Methanobacteriota archaeon]|nr:MAG: class I SAM-dependent methyltransferase [Euryarchaeota archaeon]
MNHSGMTSSEWLEVIEAMEEVAPYYDRVNQLITLGMAERWRAEVATQADEEDVVLEVGSGPGTFARHLRARRVYCLEPSGSLIRMSRDGLPDEPYELIRGVGERVPLASGSVDKVFCSFSFRDFRDRDAGASEMLRVLREGGELFIADVAKPPPSPMAKLLEMHVRHIVPVMARVAVHQSARKRLSKDPYRKFAETYDAFGFTSFYERLLRSKGFDDVSTKPLRLGGATLTRGKKPWKSTS